MKKAILIMCLLTIFTLAGCPESVPKKLEFQFTCEKAKFEEEIYYKQFTIELFKQALYYQEIESPGIVFRQAIHETGNFTSELFVKANNLFGMRLAKTRISPAIGEYRGHASYWHFYDSIRDYKMLIDYWKERGYRTEDYYTFLLNINYATDPQYISKLKYMS